MKKTILIASAIVLCCFIFNAPPAQANGYCYAKWTGVFCDLNTPDNCVETCSIVVN